MKVPEARSLAVLDDASRVERDHYPFLGRPLERLEVTAVQMQQPLEELQVRIVSDLGGGPYLQRPAQGAP